MIKLAILWSALAGVVGAQDLTGTWKLTSAGEWRPNGERIAMYGEKPAGLLCYDAKGNVSMQIQLDRKTVGGTDYIAHFGRYKMDASTGAVTHEVAGGNRPKDRGALVMMFVTLEGKRLTLGLLPERVEGEMRLRSLVWEKID
jgi:hypothetical protein